MPSGGLLACLYLYLANLGYSDVSYGVLRVGGGVGVVALGALGKEPRFGRAAAIEWKLRRTWS